LDVASAAINGLLNVPDGKKSVSFDSDSIMVKSDQKNNQTDEVTDRHPASPFIVKLPKRDMKPKTSFTRPVIIANTGLFPYSLIPTQTDTLERWEGGGRDGVDSRECGYCGIMLESRFNQYICS
jgi:hypothetical protein